MQNVVGPTLVANCHGIEIWARRGDPVAYRLVTNKRQHVRKKKLAPIAEELPFLSEGDVRERSSEIVNFCLEIARSSALGSTSKVRPLYLHFGFNLRARVFHGRGGRIDPQCGPYFTAWKCL